MNLKQLSELTPKSYKRRSVNCKSYLVTGLSDPVKDRFVFLVKCREKYSKKSGHLSSILLDPETNRKAQLAEVRVHCSCPAFKYWGSDYNATNEHYNFLSIETRPPDIRDPERKKKICKHLDRVYLDMRGVTIHALETGRNRLHKVATASEVGFMTVPVNECADVIANLSGVSVSEVEEIIDNGQIVKFLEAKQLIVKE